MRPQEEEEYQKCIFFFFSLWRALWPSHHFRGTHKTIYTPFSLSLHIYFFFWWRGGLLVSSRLSSLEKKLS
jgi:hypothetical protein